jgi:hypothetical protein
VAEVVGRPEEEGTMRRCLLPALLLALAGVARAAAPPSPSAEAAALVRQLGAAAFADREEAARGLLRLGRRAAGALHAGLRSPDLEVRRRCAALLPAVLRTDEDRRLDAFLRDGPGKGGPPWPGWASLKQVAGDGVTARLLYADLYRHDRPLLDALEKGARPSGAAVAVCAQRLQKSLSGAGGGPAPGDRVPGVAGLLVQACCASSLDPPAYSQFLRVFHYPAVRSHVRNDLALFRLAGRALAKHGTGPDALPQAVSVANSLELREVLDGTLRPAALRQVQAALSQPADLSRVSQAVNLASALGLVEAIAPRARPLARQLARTALDRPKPSRRHRWEGDDWRLHEVLHLLRTLKMQDTVETVLKPEVLKLARAVAERPEDQGEFYRVHSLVRALDAPEAREALKVAGRKAALTAAAQPEDFGKLLYALYVAEMLDLREAREAVLGPAARKQILAGLERGPGLPELGQHVALAARAGLSGLTRDTLVPAVRRRAAELRKQPPDVAQVHHAQRLAQELGLRDVTEDVVRPCLRKVLLAAEARPLNSERLRQALALARTLRMKEGAPLAGQSVARRDLDSAARAQAILFVAAFGDRAQVTRLEALLGDTTGIGSIGFSFGQGSHQCTTQLGDVALGALVHASGQSLGDFGFAYFQALPGGGDPLEESPVCFGFPDAKARAAAVAKWQKWSAARKKKAP